MKYSKKFLINIYQTMLKIRLTEESLVEPILKNEVKCPVHLYSGEEAVAVGVCAALHKNDYIYGTHRSHGHFLAKGGNLKELISEIYGKDGGCSRGRGGSMHLCDPKKGILGSAPIVAGTISLATGSALASQIRGKKNITVSFFGDGATGEGVLYESLNFAALKKLPIIFICENNFYSTHMSIKECRPENNIYKIAAPFGMPGFRVDGNDVLKVYEIAKKAAVHCRNGKGPVFIECITYRLRGHVGADDNIQGIHAELRPQPEVNRWRKREPIKRFESFLVKKGILTEEMIKKIDNLVRKEIRNAYIYALQNPYPIKENLAEYVFKE